MHFNDNDNDNDKSTLFHMNIRTYDIVMMLRHKTIINKIHWHRQPTAITHSHTHTHTHTAYHIIHITGNNRSHNPKATLTKHQRTATAQLTKQRDRITCIHSKLTTAQVQKLTWLTAVKKSKVSDLILTQTGAAGGQQTCYSDFCQCD